jgi:hypothetical protein
MTPYDAFDSDDQEHISDLFVPRPEVIGEISTWMEERAHSDTEKAVVFLLRAPPGYGKSWLLRHLANAHLDRVNPCFVVGPIPITAPLTIEWYRRTLLQRVEARIMRQIPFSPDASVGNNVAKLVDICKTATGGHPVLIVDELDRAREADMERAEREVLSTWLNNGGSVVVGIRFNRRFHIRELRTPHRYKDWKLPGFQRRETREQFTRLQALAAKQSQTPPDADAILDCIENITEESSRYAWDIPAVNRCLWGKVNLRYSPGKQPTITAADIEECAKAIISRSAPASAPDNLVEWITTIASWEYETWSSGEMVDSSSGTSVSDASKIIGHLYDLNMIERAQEGALFYRMDESWRRLLRMQRKLAGK